MNTTTENTRQNSILDLTESRIRVAPLTPDEVSDRQSKGLALEDRLTDMVLKKPSRMKEIYDQQTKSKIPMDFEAVGKPNVLVSFSGIHDNHYLTGSLNNMTIEEFVQTADYLGDNPKSGNAYHKIYQQIMKDKMENEYNRTMVADRYGLLNNDKKKDAF